MAVKLVTLGYVLLIVIFTEWEEDARLQYASVISMHVVILLLPMK